MEVPLPHPQKKVKIGKASIDNLTFEEAISQIIVLAKTGKAAYIVTPNADHVLLLEKDEEFRSVYQEASLVLPDGTPLVWGSKFLKTPLKERVTGADLLPELCKRCAQEKLSVFLLGGPPEAAALAAQNLCKTSPNLTIVGHYSPPFGFEKDAKENEKIVSMLNSSGANIVFVGVGAPKQEKWIYKHRQDINANVLLGIGAAIEFAAGTIKRAPKWMQYCGFEWFFRLCQEPRRLTKRYIRDFLFFKILYKTMRQKNT